MDFLAVSECRGVLVDFRISVPPRSQDVLEQAHHSRHVLASSQAGDVEQLGHDRHREQMRNSFDQVQDQTRSHVLKDES